MGQSERVLAHMGLYHPSSPVVFPTCLCLWSGARRPRLGVVEHGAESGVDFEGRGVVELAVGLEARLVNQKAEFADVCEYMSCSHFPG